MITKEGKPKKSFWDILAWIAYGIFFAYLLLKALHILNSLPVIDIMALSSAAFFIGRYVQKVDTCIQRLDSVENRLISVESRLISHVEGRRIHK